MKKKEEVLSRRFVRVSPRLCERGGLGTRVRSASRRNLWEETADK